MGVYTGLYPKHWSSRLMQAVSLIGISLPTFLIGILLILVFAVTLHWLPSFGRGETVVQFGWWPTNFLTVEGPAGADPAVDHARPVPAHPAHAAGALGDAGGDAHRLHQVRARAGLTNRAINFGHALKNTLVPVITVTGLQLGALIAFAIVTETVFAWPGVGQLFIQSVQFSDIPVMAAYLMLIGLLFVLINLIGRPALFRRRSAPAQRRAGRRARGTLTMSDSIGIQPAGCTASPTATSGGASSPRQLTVVAAVGTHPDRR